MEIFWFSLNVYGLMYALSFLVGFYIIKSRKTISDKNLDDFFIYIFAGVVLGWRLWYVLFYNFWYYLENLHKIFYVWEWGMSFHWWTIWVIIAMVLFSYFKKLNFFKISDELTSVLPIGLFLGRIWNYFNKELLWYQWYTWLFKVELNGINYFPSPLLEALLEWIILFLILCYVYRNKKFNGQVASVFLIWYGIFRLFVELLFRQPDDHLWYIIGNLSMGSILTIPMILSWIWFYFYLSQKNAK